MTIAASTKLGRYEIRSKIGAGGMGDVYLAQDRKLDRKVALKILPAEVAADRNRMSRFVQEAKAASALNHPNIITIYEIEHIDSVNFIATEFIDGVTLRQRMRAAPMKVGEVLDVAAQIAGALSAAHAAGIVHRDVKPENVILRADGIVKVLDFGLAKLTERPPPDSVDAEAATKALVQTEPGVVMGTVAYMSPEQARGLVVDARTDIWSLGVVLYEMVARRAPFEGTTSSDLIASVLKTEPPPLAHYIEVPIGLGQIVTKTLRKESEQRYQTATELLNDLQSLKQELEFESQGEHSPRPDSGGRAAVTKSEREAAVDTDNELWTRTGLRRTPVPTTSVEYLVNQFKRHKRTAIVALATLALTVAAVTLGWHKFFGGKQAATGMSAKIFSQIQVTKLATNGNPTVASISPDGKYVAYALVEAGRQSLWVRQVDIASNHQIVSPAEVEYQGLTFSPDGNYVYYGIFDYKDKEALYRVPVLGGIATKVMEDLVSAKLSPDGSQIAFGRLYQDKNEIDLMIVIANADGSGEQTVALRKPDTFGWWYKSGPA